jgi:hypothetical protein
VNTLPRVFLSSHRQRKRENRQIGDLILDGSFVAYHDEYEKLTTIISDTAIPLHPRESATWDMK